MQGELRGLSLVLDASVLDVPYIVDSPSPSRQSHLASSGLVVSGYQAPL
jgi:hypothetical protein